MLLALFGFNGRLNRAPFWGYSLLLVVVIVIVQLVIVSSVLAPQMAVLMEQVGSGNTPTAQDFLGMFSGMAPKLGWLAIIIQVVFSFPAAALSVKRRHDRDKSGLDVWIYIGLSIVISVLQLLGIGMTTGEVRGVAVMMPDTWMQVVQLALVIFGLYLFIVLAFLRGTIGQNSYGPDPLGG
ncbi:MAG: DUF805 domain-containing protein [Devosia sp.]